MPEAKAKEELEQSSFRAPASLMQEFRVTCAIRKVKLQDAVITAISDWIAKTGAGEQKANLLGIKSPTESRGTSNTDQSGSADIAQIEREVEYAEKQQRELIEAAEEAGILRGDRGPDTGANPASRKRARK